MKNAKSLKLNRGPHSAAQLAPADEGGAPVVIPPTGPQGAKLLKVKPRLCTQRTDGGGRRQAGTQTLSSLRDAA